MVATTLAVAVIGGGTATTVAVSNNIKNEPKTELSNYTAFEDLVMELPDTSAMIKDVKLSTDISCDLNNDGNYISQTDSLGTTWPTDTKYILNKEGKLEEVTGWRYYLGIWSDIENEKHEVLKDVRFFD